MLHEVDNKVTAPLVICCLFIK